MATGRVSALVPALSAVALALVLAACTPGGQFDPTEVLSTDVFNTKKKLNGDREPLFPQGVPGAETGVPPDLVKGYQPPPEPAAAENNPDAAAKAAAAEKPKPKPRPKPKVARVAPAASAPPPPPMSPGAVPPQQGRDPVWDRIPTSPTARAPAQPPAQAQAPAQTPWPAPAQQAPTNWPAPPDARPSQ